MMRERQELQRIYIRDLTVNCIIGTEPKERVMKQDVVINVIMECDFAPATQTDRLEDTVNYVRIRNRIQEIVEPSGFFLLERMADRVIDVCLEDPRVKSATVTIDKPGALTGARSVAVEISRRRE